MNFNQFHILYESQKNNNDIDDDQKREKKSTQINALVVVSKKQIIAKTIWFFTMHIYNNRTTDFYSAIYTRLTNTIAQKFIPWKENKGKKGVH